MIRILILLSVFLLSCTAGVRRDKVQITFVQISDPQFGFGLEGYEHDLVSFRQAVKQTNELKPDFVVICGDLVHHATDSAFSDFIRIKEGFEMPCYVVPGNHDVGNIPNDKTLGYYRKTIGKDYYMFQHKGYSFFITNSLLWKSHVENETVKHDQWFKEMVEKQSEEQTPIIVFGHYPLYVKSPEEEEDYYNFPLNKREELLNLFLQNNVKAYISGHTHMAVINNYHNIQLVSGETTSRNFDTAPLGFRLWKISSDTINHHFVSLQLPIINQSEPDYETVN